MTQSFKPYGTSEQQLARIHKLQRHDSAAFARVTAELMPLLKQSTAELSSGLWQLERHARDATRVGGDAAQALHDVDSELSLLHETLRWGLAELLETSNASVERLRSIDSSLVDWDKTRAAESLRDARLCLANGWLDDARELFEKALERHRFNFRAHWGLGEAYATAGASSAAALAYRKAFLYSAPSAPEFAAAAALAAATVDPEVAIEVLKEASSRLSKCSQILIGLGMLTQDESLLKEGMVLEPASACVVSAASPRFVRKAAQSALELLKGNLDDVEADRKACEHEAVAADVSLSSFELPPLRHQQELPGALYEVAVQHALNVSRLREIEERSTAVSDAPAPPRAIAPPVPTVPRPGHPGISRATATLLFTSIVVSTLTILAVAAFGGSGIVLAFFLLPLVAGGFSGSTENSFATRRHAYNFGVEEWKRYDAVTTESKVMAADHLAWTRDTSRREQARRLSAKAARAQAAWSRPTPLEPKSDFWDEP